MTANKFQKYLVGTLFDEEEQDKKTNLSNMKAKDPMGNTRWKGAFTGGFEAGFKNTCGSKEGWVPSTFVSSIYKKAEKTQRTIFDYMDKQDLGRESISQNISLNQNFQIAKSQSLNISLQQSIGEKILSKLKKAEAHRTAPESFQQLDRLFLIYAQQDKEKPKYQLKDLTQPISVGGQQNQLPIDEFIDAYEDFYKKVIREQNKEETEEEIKKRKEENKVYFDFTRPLEQQPQYLRQIQDLEDAEKPRKRKKNLINEQNLKSLFTPSVAFKQFKQTVEIEKAPEDYDPFARMRGLQMIGQKKEPQQPVRHHRSLTVDKRSELLGETKLSSKFVSSQNSLTNKFISNQKKVEELVKIFEDEKKNKRFHEYVEEMEGKKISSQLSYLSYQQAEKERTQFEQMYTKQKKANQQETKSRPEHFVVKKEGVSFRISRQVESWRPEKLLCKRFNVLMPYTKKDTSSKGDYQYF